MNNWLCKSNTMPLSVLSSARLHCTCDFEGHGNDNDISNLYIPGNLLLFVNVCLLLQIRRKMREIMVNQATSCDLKELVRKFIPESIGKEIEKATSSIYPLQNVFIRKVKILKAPKFDLGKLMEVYNTLLIKPAG